MKTTHRKNVASVVGQEVIHVGDPTTKAKIVDYHAPLVWELDRKLFGRKYWPDYKLRLPEGERIHTLVPFHQDVNRQSSET